MIKIETLSKMVNDLWQDDDINGVVLRIKFEDITTTTVLDCRNITALDAEEVKPAIDDAITTSLLNIMKEAENRFTGPIKIGPVKYVRISKSYLDSKIIECHATLEGGLVPQFKEEKK